MWQMPGYFLGDLSKRRLFAIIKPLVETKKSGLITIQGSNRAELHIEKGAFIHAETDVASGEEAILAIMGLEEGEVFFDSQTAAGKRTVTTVTEQFMSDWGQKEEEWERIRKVVPSYDAVFSIVVESGGQERVIRERYWGVLALCNGIRSVSDVAAALERSLFDVCKAICEMVGAGLVEKARTAGVENARATETVDGSLFTALQTELTKVMGPIARVIINDTLTVFEETREAFPRDQVASFIRTVSDQIADEQKREQFGKAAYAFLLSPKTQ